MRVIADDMALDVIADIIGLTDEAGPSKIGYLLRDTIFDNEPDIIAWNHCLLLFVGISRNIDGCWGVNFFGIDVEMEIILAFNVRLG